MCDPRRHMAPLLWVSGVDFRSQMSALSCGDKRTCCLQIKPKVSTVCFGVAASQGALLLAGGAKGKRFSMPNARIMIHQPQGGCGVRLLTSPVFLCRWDVLLYGVEAGTQAAECDSVSCSRLFFNNVAGNPG